MKYVVAAPPGALGHFLSKVLVGNYDFTAAIDGSYHGLHKLYLSQTTQIEKFNQVVQDIDNASICLHNFDNRDLSLIYKDKKIVNIVVDSQYEIFLNNWFRKSIQSSDNYLLTFLNKCSVKFPTSQNYVREEFFFMYQSMIKKEISWLPQQTSGNTVLFSSCYNKKLFVAELQKISELSTVYLEQVWKHFVQAQQPILDRVLLYQTICDQVLQQDCADIPEYFDNVDFGIMCGMIYVQTGIDKLNLKNNNWL